MPRTGPQKYPGANLSEYFQGRYPGNAMESNVGCLHTTEGTTLPDYDGGASAPNLTAVPNFAAKRLDWFQHYDIDTSARALVNRSGGVETNTANVVQVELVGTCDERRRATWGTLRAGVDYLFWPDAPDWALKGLADFVKWCRDNHGIRAQSTVEWKAYKQGQDGGSYGASNGVRLTGAEWGAYYGWLGHQHVPENDHGDPGNLNFARVLELIDTPIPAPGAFVTKPDRQMVYRTEDTQLLQNNAYTIYWTSEGQDDGQGHGQGGKTVATNVCYSSVLNLTFTGIPEGGYVEVYPVEEDASGVQTGSGRSHYVNGRIGGGPVSVAVPVIGLVTNRLAFQVVNRSAPIVTMVDAQAASQFCPNA